MREKGGNCVAPGPDYMVDALKLPNQTPRVSDESLQKCMAWCCPDGTQHLFCWPILGISGQSLASNGPVDDRRDLNLVFDHAAAPPQSLLHNIVVCDSFLIPSHHPFKKWSISFHLAKASQIEIRSIMFFGVNWCGTKT
ncbi:hypothetical protein TNCV_4834321 [Trichonephila clavipes]|nr:hypothetical protein TNCV_4834321 [Trichonephila clavipes]